jgi:hypothetical protein
METNIKTNNMYDWIPDKYTEDEKNEVIRLINEYADICVSILMRNADNNDDKTNYSQEK